MNNLKYTVYTNVIFGILHGSFDVVTIRIRVHSEVRIWNPVMLSMGIDSVHMCQPNDWMKDIR